MPTLTERYLRAKRALFDKAYSNLNDKQREAVFTVNHPLLILAGAGSGKTTVLVQRIAFIIRYGDAYGSEHVPFDLSEQTVTELEQAVALSPDELHAHVLPRFATQACEPYRMLAITFTNKAANEIKERLAKMFDGEEGVATDIWAGTFHSICMRILRRHGERMGYRDGFTIYDEDDRKKTVLAAMQRIGIDEKLLPAKTVINAISRAKDELLSPDEYSMRAGIDYRKKQIARVYESYQQILRESNALDFDDIIMQTVLLLAKHPDVRDAYANRFRYVCVDEFQDTNVAQMKLTELFASGHKNLMVVGDDDQSIYKFRGATIENILTFDRAFPDTKTIKLEQNYRSTQTILDAANAVISTNRGRKGKRLWTEQGAGEKISITLCDDQNAEARFVADEITRLVSGRGKASLGELTYRDVAVLYRTNAQANSLEKAFARAAIPHRTLGATRFFDRKEIRDVVAYLQLINNQDDNTRLMRIINEPKRKLGARTLEAIAEIAEELSCSQFSVISRADQFPALSRSAPTLLAFADMILSLSEASKTLSLDQLYERMLDKTGYRQMWIDAGREEERVQNLEEFKSGILEYLQENEEPTLTGFLEENALVADVDRYDETANAVVLMTIHSAKGLEFPIVFLPGMEDGIFPGMQSIMSGDSELEEECRLAYVALTRAKKKLYILHTRSRLLYSQTMFNPISRFASMIPESLIEKTDRSQQSGGPSFGSRFSYGSRYGDDSSQAPTVRTYYSAPQTQSTPARPRNTGEQITVGRPLQRTAQPRPATLSPGDRVRHASFGEGEVLSVKPMGADTLYEIVFDTVGTKKMMATYARLTKI
ncbi:MAG: UvrD-helicase domain-containing protein [Clostridia bacterium]|nr:UvrD-helicase domain-containing protein [Clostridia bacterium]